MSLCLCRRHLRKKNESVPLPPAPQKEEWSPGSEFQVLRVCAGDLPASRHTRSFVGS